jgi:hypothetical protein
LYRSITPPLNYLSKRKSDKESGHKERNKLAAD